MKPNHSQSDPAGPAARPGKYLAFTLAGGIYAVPVMAVREIIRLCPITPVATMPPHVRGVINLRGRVIPLIDLRVRFGLPAAPDHDRTCIVVGQVAAGVEARPYAVVVDGVEEVAAFSADDIVPPPDFGAGVELRFVTGMARRAAGVTTLVDLDAVAAADWLPEAAVLSPS